MNKPYFSIQWHITDMCDQRCKHCYIFSEGYENLCSMDFNKMLHVIDHIEEMCLKMDRTPYIYLTGGDPILHPSFWPLLEEFHKRYIRFCIMGNPFHLTDEVCKRMHNLGCVKYQVSLDGLEEMHDSFRKKGSFKATLNAIEIIKRSGMWVAVMSTVSKTNYKDIIELIDLVDKLNVDVFAFGRYCPTSVTKAYDPNIHMTPLEYRNFLSKCWEKFKMHKDSHTTFQLKDHLWSLFLYENGYIEKPKNLDLIESGCNCGRNHITITPKGDIYACRRFESKVGNIFEENLYDVWMSQKMDYYRQYDKFVKCAKCELRGICRGCPSVTYGYTHNMFDKDPQCWKEI